MVTGSHIAVSTFNSPTPVTVIDASTIQNLGLVGVGDIINQIPSNSNFTSSQNIGEGNFYIGAQFADLRGLNPFFGTRTLTLIDSQRFVPTAAGGQVDLNVIPSIMVARTETVTGGASAAYGSDAVAGVINIILDNKLEGFKFQADGGETTYDDGGDMHVAAAYGVSLADGHIHNVFAAEYEDSQGIGKCGEVRPWCAEGAAEFINTGYTTNGLPHYVIGNGGTTYAPYSGVAASLTGTLTQFNSAGTGTVPFNSGPYGSAFEPSQNGAGPNYYDNVTIEPPVIHSSFYDHVNYDVSSSLQLTLDLSFSQRRATNDQGAYAAIGAPTNVLYANNPYLPASAVGACTPFCFFDDNIGNQLQLTNSTENNVGRIVLGASGDFFAGWKWDGYAEWGENGTRERLANDVVESFGVSPALTGVQPAAGIYDYFNWALDAVKLPSGQIVCAATIKGNAAYNPLAAGCVPINLVGSNNASAAALAYSFRTLHQDSAFLQDVISFNTHGDLFSGWGAGPIAAAVGAEYRHSMADVTHDLQDQPWYSQYFLSYGGDYSGDTDVVEGYTEFQVPILKNRPFAQSLNLDVSARESEWKSSNTLTGVDQNYNFPSWKFGLNWDPVDWLRLRATRSRDTRAPSFYELWAQTVDTGGLFGTVANPWVNPPGSANYGSAVDVARVASGGSSSTVGLRPEKADTTTVGVVLQPENSGFQFSVDWYQIIIDGAISEVGAASLVDACYDGNKYYCQFIEGVSNGAGGFSSITAVNNVNLNIGSYTTRGYDFEGDYKLPFSRFVAGRNDSLDFRVLATYQYDQIINPGAGVPAYNYAGQTGPTSAFGDFNTVPKWQGNAFLTYSLNPFTAVLQMRVIGSGKYEEIDSNTGLPVIGEGQAGYSSTYGASINNNTVASATYFNLSLTYTLPFFNQGNQMLQVFGKLDNVLNRSPPIAPGGNGYPTNPVYFDTIGRTWRVGARLQF